MMEYLPESTKGEIDMKHLGSNYPIESSVCEECGVDENLTKHHVKDIKFRKTGEIQILCRECHDNIERKLEKNGMLGKRLALSRERND